MYVQTNTAIENPLTLTLPSFAARTVSIYADQPEIIKIPGDNEFPLDTPHICVTL
jgi:hypothetical protein